MLDLSFQMTAITWQNVYEIQHKNRLQKSLITTPNKDILHEANKVDDKQGVYSFQSDGIVYYIGKFSEYNSSGTSLKNRLKQYLQNDDSQKTNVRIFDNINKQLEVNSVAICVLRYEDFTLKERNEKSVNYFRWASANDKNVNRTIEGFLIAFYKQRNQAAWNLE